MKSKNVKKIIEKKLNQNAEEIKQIIGNFWSSIIFSIFY